jgi:hypothetical protein
MGGRAPIVHVIWAGFSALVVIVIFSMVRDRARVIEYDGHKTRIELDRAEPQVQIVLPPPSPAPAAGWPGIPVQRYDARTGMPDANAAILNSVMQNWWTQMGYGNMHPAIKCAFGACF